MAKRTPSVDDDGSVEFSIEPRKSREFKGNDESPVDADTGEAVFEDISPRFRAHVNAAAGESEPEDDEDEDVLDEEESEDLDEEADELATKDKDLDEKEEAEEEGEDSRNKRGIRDRLKRSQRLLEEERANNEDLRARMDQLEANQTTRASDEEFSKTKAVLDAEIEKLSSDLETAMEEGETKKTVRLVGQLTDAKAKLQAATSDHERAKAAAKEAPKQVTTIAARKADQWKRKHGRFTTDPVFNAFVIAVDKQVHAAGFRADSDEYYKELDKRIRAKYPEEYRGQRAEPEEKGNRQEAPKRRKPPTVAHRNHQSSTREGGDFQVRNGKVKLTERQLANMKMFQLDPSNPADVRSYVLENRGSK